MAVVKESRPGENRVAMVPEVAARLIKAGADVVVEAGAGDAARFADDRYGEAGATVAADVAGATSGAVLVARVQAPTPVEVDAYPSGVSVISFLQPLAELDSVRALAEKGRDGLQPRPAAANQPGPVHGRALLAVHGGRLPCGARAPPSIWPSSFPCS